MSRILVSAIAAVLIVAGITLGRMYITNSHSGGEASNVKIGGAFELVDHNGNRVTDETYHGKYPLVFFGYTFCPDVCPTNLSTIASALDMMKPEHAKQIVPLFISVDPERDTQDTLSTYVSHFHEQVVGLTGSPEQIKDVARKYKAYYAKVNSDDPEHYLIDHSATTYLMDTNGKFKSIFTHGTAPDVMANQLNALFE